MLENVDMSYCPQGTVSCGPRLYFPLKLFLGLVVRQAFITRSLINSRTIRLSLDDVAGLLDMLRVSRTALCIWVVGDATRNSVQSLRVDLGWKSVTSTSQDFGICSISVCLNFISAKHRGRRCETILLEYRLHW